MSDSDKKDKNVKSSEDLIEEVGKELDEMQFVEVGLDDEEAEQENEEEILEHSKAKKKRKRRIKKKEQNEQPKDGESQEDGDSQEEPETGVVYLDEGEKLNLDFDGEEDSVEEKLARHRKKKKILKVTGIIFGALVAVYLGISIFFISHFYFGTKINGNNANAKSVKQMEAFMEKHVKGYSLTIQHSDGEADVIRGEDIHIAYKKSDALQKALEKQNPFLWPMGLIEPQKLEVAVDTEYDEAALEKLLAELPFTDEKNQKKPESAKPEFDGNQFVVKKEVLGTQLVTENFEKALDKYIRTFRDTLVLADEDCYVLPKYTETSEEVAAACETMNKYLKAQVTYDFNPHTEVVDKSVISKWLSVDGDMKVTFSKKEVEKYIKELANKYDTSGKPRKFVTANGNTVTVQNGIYGWKINKKKEYEALTANIQAGEVVKREPVYSRKAKSHEGNDFGNTYAEVDLTGQHMWFIKDGKKVMDSPIVTGNPNKGNATPQGTYTLTYKQKGAVLRGPKQPDGSYEWESPVDFWMPFNGGIGFHDATWQSAFGGNRYQSHGSHGCINMPYEKAKELFSYMEAGMPVICHY